MQRRTNVSKSGLSRRAALGSAGAIAAALGLGSQLGRAAAQDDTTDAMASHPIVGAWLFMNATVPPSPSTAIFAADGSVVVESAVNYKDAARGLVYASDLVGTWEPTGPRSIHITGIVIESDANGVYTGTSTLDGYPVVSEDGQTWTDDGTQAKLTIRDAANAVVAVLGGGGGEPPITPPVVAARMRPGPLTFPPMPAAAGTFPGAAPATPAA
jgi:hypothetical protein